MRAAPLLAALVLAAPADAQRPGPHDGRYVGSRFQDCGTGGRAGEERVTAEIRGSRVVIPALPGDPPLEGAIGPDGRVALGNFGLFRAGEGQVLEGANDARRLTAQHPGRGRCRLVHDLRRVAR